MRHCRIAFWCLLAVGLLACGAAVKDAGRSAPDWLNGESARFSSKQYLLGRGADLRLDNAKDRARADIAKVFQVAVAEESSDVQRFQRKTADGRSEEAQSLDTSRAVRTRSEALISGIDIADIWRDPLSREYYALAVLPRAQSARGLRQDIQALDEATRGHIARAREQRDGLDQVRASAQAVTAQRERAEYQRMLRVVDSSGQGLPAPWNIAELEADLATLLKRMTIAPRAGGENNENLQRALRAGLADSGFHAADDGAADYFLEASLSLNDLGKREGWYWYAGSLELTLRDQTGRVRGSQRWNIKESATLDAMARQRAADKAAEILKRELPAILLGFTQG
ncbi:MAG: LPP20 family lipoprotein [Pseudomonadota bacterium]